MKNFQFAKRLTFLLLLTAAIFTIGLASCQKEQATSVPETAIRNPFDVEKQILDLVDNTVDPMAPIFDEEATFTDAQIRTIFENQSIWTYEEIAETMKDSRSSFDEKYKRLKAKIPNNLRAENEQTLETFSKRSTGYIQDSNPDHLAQMIAASGSTVGINSSLNIYRPINDDGKVTYFDIYIATIRQANTVADQVVEYLPESVVFEYEVSGGNWLIAADIVHNVGGIPDTTHYCFDCPNSSLIWNPTLSSPADDDVIQGPMPLGIVSISANGLIPPPPIE